MGSPAEEYRDEDGKLHRDDGPALVFPNGTMIYYRHGQLHRLDGPAITGPPPGRIEFFFIDGISFLNRDEYYMAAAVAMLEERV